MSENALSLLIVDDNEDIRKQLKWALSQAGYTLHFARDAAEALQLYHTHAPGVVTLDLGLPPCTADASQGLACLEKMLAGGNQTKIIVITGFDDHENARKALEMGAYDFFRKPIDIEDLKVMIRRAFTLSQIERLHVETAPSQLDPGHAAHGIIGQCQPMRKVFAMIEKMAGSDVPVLICGESGTGKELVAQAIHRLGPRKKRPLVCINCGAIPENLLESEFFGHERGAFTGAVSQTTGKVETADRGTLFLDEIGEMPVNLQVKLLRFLQEMRFQRVGGAKSIEVDVRILAATNINIEEAMRAGQFREDLYYRIGVVTIEMPPLRVRKDDILLLAEHFLSRHAAQNNKMFQGFTPQAKECLKQHLWPGNVRELDNKVRRAVVLAGGPHITPAHLGFAEACAPAAVSQENEGHSLREARAHLESRMVLEALKVHAGNILKASEYLGISRPTLYELMRKHGIMSPPR